MNARFFLASAALLCATVSVGSAVSAAAEPLHARSARVSFADLDLDSAAGRAVLERRVSAAADRICRVNGYTDLGSLRAGEACFDKAVDQAMGQVRMASRSNIQFAEVQGSAGGR